MKRIIVFSIIFLALFSVAAFSALRPKKQSVGQRIPADVAVSFPVDI